MQNFEGKVCVITGAASGIGRECALQIGLKNKARLALFDINGEKLGDVVREVNDQGGKCNRDYLRCGQRTAGKRWNRKDGERIWTS